MRLLLSFTLIILNLMSFAQTGPGGVATNLDLWLRADAGTSTTINGATIATWTNQVTGKPVTSVTQTNVSERPTYLSSFFNLNYQPTLDFDGTDDNLFSSVSALSSGTCAEMNIFTVAITEGGDAGVFGLSNSNGNRINLQLNRKASSLSFLDFFSGAPRAITNQSPGLGIPSIMGGYNSVTNNFKEIVFNGHAKNTDAGGVSYASGVTRVGTVLTNTLEHLNGQISEVIAYNTDLTDTQKMQVYSYLGIKYGITLDNTGGGVGGDYLSSSGTTIWDASSNAAYHHEVVGIGRDDRSGLAQKQSKPFSNNTGIFMATLASSNATNTGTISNDESFVMMGHNSGGLRGQQADVPVGIVVALDRKWKVVNTNFTESFSFETIWDTSLGSFDINHVRLLVDDDGDFSNATILGPSDGLTFTIGSKITVNGITNSHIPANSIRYITIASNNIATLLSNSYPGGVFTNIEFWLKADGNTSTTTEGDRVATWGNQVIEGTLGGVSQSTNASRPIYRTSFPRLNYQPALEFDGVDDELLSSTTALSSGNAREMNIFAVAITEGGQGGLFSLNDGNNQRINLQLRRSSITFLDFLGGSGRIGTTDIPGISEVGIVGVYNSVNNNRREIVIDGDSKNILAGGIVQTSNITRVGSVLTGMLEYLTGQIAEVLVYGTDLSNAQKARILSYLAIKYGITLDNSADGTAGDYFSSTGNTIWDASLNANYHHDVIGIGKDDNSGLLQKQSKTQDDSLRIFVSNIAASNAANTGTIANNESFVMIGHNNGRLQGQLTEMPLGIVSRFGREWKVSNFNFADSYSLEIEWDSVGTFNINDIRLLVDDDGDFSNATILGPSDGLSFSTGSIIVSNLSTAHIPLNSTRYITIASISSTSPLPIDLLSFSAKNVRDQSVLLAWQTISELNNDFFTVERSVDGLHWQSIATLPGKGNSSALNHYSITDASPHQGLSYYRLKQSDYNGDFSFSKVVAVRIGKPSNMVQLYPSPTNGPLTVTGLADPTSVRIFNALGQEVTQLVKIEQKDTKRIIMNLSELSQGIYFVHTPLQVKKIYKK